MKIHTCEQRSEEWFQLRLGRVTGTRFKDLMTARPPGFETLCRKIAAERMTGKSADQPFRISAAMEQGIEREDEARAAYEIRTFQRVEEVGFISRDNWFGVSPDGIILKEPLETSHGLEVKCPLPGTHLGYLMDPSTLYKAYKWQVLGSIWVSGFESWDLISYCPEFKEERKVVFYKIRLSEEDPDRALIDDKADQLRARVKEIINTINKEK